MSTSEINCTLPNSPEAESWGKELIVLDCHWLVLPPDDSEISVYSWCLLQPHREPKGAGEFFAY